MNLHCPACGATLLKELESPADVTVSLTVMCRSCRAIYRHAVRDGAVVESSQMRPPRRPVVRTVHRTC